MSIPAAESNSDRMSALEWRVGVSLASIFGLRMLGLFLVLPVFSVFASGLPGGENFQLVSLAFGAFMMVQALLYLPFGFASDRFGRKPVIVFGLLLFAAGSFLAAWAPNIYWMIAARALQGTGAVSAAVTALASDLTREQHRTKVMALIGSTIGLAFSVSLVLSPMLYAWIGMPGMFSLIAVLALLAIPLLLRVVPNPPASGQTVRERVPVQEVLKDTQLLRLNFGIFALHVLQTAMFLVVPHQLIERHGLPLGQHWHVYLPVVLGSFVIAIPAIVQSERKGRTKAMFLASIALLVVSQLGLWLTDNLPSVVVMLLLFFAAFNVLEASLPALVSRVAPQRAKGTALGIFNTTQSLGVAAGSAAGGWIAVHFGTHWINGMAVGLALLWGAFAVGMRVPARLIQKTIALLPGTDPDLVRERIASLPGVREVAVERERGIATIKINPERWDEARLQRAIGGEA